MSSNSSLPEHWTQLNAARRNRQQCAEDVVAIKQAAEKEDGVKHIAQDPQKYAEALDRILGRFKDSKDQEWFSQRGAVIFTLENMIADAKEGKTSLKDIETSIGSEKEAWYRWVLRRYPEFLAVAESGVDQEEVRSLLDDPDRSREELVALVSQAVGMSDDWSTQVDAFVEKVAAVRHDEPALKKLYVEEFFKDRTTGETLENAQEYLNTYESDPDMRLETVIDRIIAANQEDRSTQTQRVTHQRRLDELRRAKTAFEQNKAQAKSQAQQQQQGAQGSKVDERYYTSMPPCAVCGKDVDTNNVISCPICQLAFQMSSEGKLTVYCSDACHDKGFDGHWNTAHPCSAGDKCVYEQVDEGEDVEMEDASAGDLACNECLDNKQVTIFCSRKCADQNLAAHRKTKHGLETDNVAHLASPLDRVVEQALTEDNTGLKFQ